MNGGQGQSTTIAYNLPGGESGAAAGLAKAYLRKAYEYAILAPENYEDAHDTPYAPYQYVDSHYPEWEGIVALAARLNGNATVNKGKTFIESVLNGSYLTNVYTDVDFVEMTDDVSVKPTTTFTNDVIPLLGGSLYLVGDLSGENIANSLASTLAARYTDRTAAAIKNSIYQTERERQSSVARAALAYADEDIKNAEASHKAGLRHRVWLHGFYKTKYELWQDETTEQYRTIEILGNGLSTLINAEQKRVDTYHKPSPVAGMVGGAMAGAPLGPYGIAAGAVFGLLGSQ